MKLFFKIAILAVLLVFAFKSCGPLSGLRNPLIGQQAPDFTLETLQGQKASMLQYRGNQPVMIFFWATWCPHCRTQLKGLMQQRDQIKQMGIKIILVDVGESLGEVKAFCETNNISMDVFLDENGEVSNNYRVAGIPTFIFINKEGIVKAVGHQFPQNYEEILLGLVS